MVNADKIGVYINFVKVEKILGIYFKGKNSMIMSKWKSFTVFIPEYQSKEPQLITSSEEPGSSGSFLLYFKTKFNFNNMGN